MERPLEANEVLDAVLYSGTQDTIFPSDGRIVAAAALRSAACLGKRDPEHWEGSFPDDFDKGWNAAMAWIESLASELHIEQSAKED